MGLMDREYMHERHKNSSAPNRYIHPELKKLKFQRAYPKPILILLYLIVACLPVLLYLQMPIPVNKPSVAAIGKQLNCAIDEIKLDANRDGVLTLTDFRPLTLHIFSLPARYVNSSDSLTPIASLLNIKNACNGRIAAIFNGFAWLLGYILLAKVLVLIGNVAQSLLNLILFRVMRFSQSKKIMNTLHWILQPKWNFSTNLIVPIILCGGVTIVSIISADENSAVSVQQPRPTPVTSANITSRLENIKNLLAKGVITQSEYDAKKKEILNSL